VTGTNFIPCRYAVGVIFKEEEKWNKKNVLLTMTNAVEPNVLGSLKVMIHLDKKNWMVAQ
jgi:hypothetical protein